MLKKTIFFDLFGVLLGWSITGFKPLKPTSLLQGLSNYHLLYIISNTSNGQINVLKNKFDFFQYFTKIFTSETIGHNKPDLTIFKYALQEICFVSKLNFCSIIHFPYESISVK